MLAFQSVSNVAQLLVSKKTLHKIAIVSFVVSANILLGCAGKSRDVDLKAYNDTENSPDVLYNQALANLKSGNFHEASRKFEIINQLHPYTELARRSILMGIFSYYRQNKYDEAANMAQRYIVLYPASSDAAYAYYIIGLSHFRQIPDVTRDQEDARRAISAMKEVINRYPTSEYAIDAKSKIRFAREQLAGKEMQIGRYYLERAQYIAAIRRFRLVVEEYFNTNQLEEALYRLSEANYAIGLVSEAKMAAYVLGQNYPNGRWYTDAVKLLKKGGLNPQEDKSGWMSLLPNTKNKK